MGGKGGAHTHTHQSCRPVPPGSFICHPSPEEREREREREVGEAPHLNLRQSERERERESYACRRPARLGSHDVPAGTTRRAEGTKEPLPLPPPLFPPLSSSYCPVGPCRSLRAEQSVSVAVGGLPQTGESSLEHVGRREREARVSSAPSCLRQRIACRCRIEAAGPLKKLPQRNSPGGRPAEDSVEVCVCVCVYGTVSLYAASLKKGGLDQPLSLVLVLVAVEQLLLARMIDTVSQDKAGGAVKECGGCGKKIHDRYLLQALGRQYRHGVHAGCCFTAVAEMNLSKIVAGPLLYGVELKDTVQLCRCRKLARGKNFSFVLCVCVCAAKTSAAGWR